MLAHGFTRNTLIAAEGNTLAPVDDGGRFFYCPPNSAGNAHFLSMLRNLLVQDWDLDDDGEPETLRLLFGTSRRWLEDGKADRGRAGTDGVRAGFDSSRVATERGPGFGDCRFAVTQSGQTNIASRPRSRWLARDRGERRAASGSRSMTAERSI